MKAMNHFEIGMEENMEKVLLNLNEVSEYLGLGKTKTREIMTKTKNPFTVRIGNRLYANKTLLDRWINDKSGKSSIESKNNLIRR